MSDENTGADVSQASEGGAQAEDLIPKSEFQKVIGQRQEFKSKARELEAKLAEYEAAEREREEEKMRKQGEFEKLLEAERAEKQALAKQIADMNHKERFARTVAEVSKKAGIDPVLAEALLLREQQVSGADVALEEVTDEAVTDLAKALKKSAPSLFQTVSKGGSPTTPGLNPGNKDAGELDGKGKWFAKAQALSAHNRKQKG